MGGPEIKPARHPRRRSRWDRLRRRFRLDYLKILRTSGAPGQVARGVAYGIFIELLFFPTLGLGFLLFYPLNHFLRGHYAASLAGFVFAKLFAFLTIPPSILLGKWILGVNVSVDMIDRASFSASMKSLWALLKGGQLLEFLGAWTVGAAIFGVVLGAAGFWLSWSGLKNYQARRHARRDALLHRIHDTQHPHDTGKTPRPGSV